MKQIIAGICLSAIAYGAGAQVISDSVLIEGHYRSFHFNTPAFAGRGASLMFVMHGSGGNGLGAMKNTAKLEALSGAQQVLLVYPDGYKRYWNECRGQATTPPNLENINEEAFFTAMINYFQEKYVINPKKVFAAGFSGGGHMAYKLAVTMPLQFKAVAAIVANLPDSAHIDCKLSNKPVSIMIVNGTTDPVNPYNGGVVTSTGVVLGTVRSTDATVAYWSRINGFTGAPVKTLLPDTDPADGKTIEQYRYHDAAKHDVVLLKVINGKHDYPNDIDVYVKAWEFFKEEMEK